MDAVLTRSGNARAERSADRPSARAAPPEPPRNRLLDAASADERGRLLAAAETVRLRRGQIVHEPGDCSAHAWLPTSAAVSILYATRSGASGEIALIGNEGIVGWSPFAGHGSSLSRAVVCVEGDALRVRTRLVASEFERSGPLMRALLLHTETLISQMSQLVACNRHHALEQQLCRLLLATLDRVPDRQIIMTHEAMATRLGVRREGVTLAAHGLRDAGVIGYSRGRITVHDRRALEARSCECYAAIAEERARLPR